VPISIIDQNSFLIVAFVVKLQIGVSNLKNNLRIFDEAQDCCNSSSNSLAELDQHF
jgi:hypothetical protein